MKLKLKLTDEQLEAIRGEATVSPDEDGWTYYDRENFKNAFHLVEKEVQWVDCNNDWNKGILKSIKGGSFPFLVNNISGVLCIRIKSKQDEPVNKEKPVNEACLFKPVFFRDRSVDRWQEGIYAGFVPRDEKQYQSGIKSEHGHGFDGTWSFYYAKRIPGYDYGDNDD